MPCADAPVAIPTKGMAAAANALARPDPTKASPEMVAIATPNRPRCSYNMRTARAAIHTTLTSLLQAGDHVVAQRAIYGGTFALLKQVFPRYGIQVDLVEPEESRGSDRLHIRIVAVHHVRIVMQQEIAFVHHFEIAHRKFPGHLTDGGGGVFSLQAARCSVPSTRYNVKL